MRRKIRKSVDVYEDKFATFLNQGNAPKHIRKKLEKIWEDGRSLKEIDKEIPGLKHKKRIVGGFMYAGGDKKQ